MNHAAENQQVTMTKVIVLR